MERFDGRVSENLFRLAVRVDLYSQGTEFADVTASELLTEDFTLVKEVNSLLTACVAKHIVQ